MMMKKFIVMSLIAMIGTCFADYKSAFNWNLNDETIIEKGIAQATAAKDTCNISNYTLVKMCQEKSISNMNYDQFKEAVLSNKLIIKVGLPQVIICNKAACDKFLKSILNDRNLSDSNKSYLNHYFPLFPSVIKCLGANEWRKRFINLQNLNNYRISREANVLFRVYCKNSSNFSANEIKEDMALFKRAWYSNIADSDEWKTILVKVELMNKSVQ